MVVLLGVGYFVLARFGMTYTVMPEGIAVVWLPNALLLAVFLTSRYSHWPVFACAALIAEVAADLPAFPLWAALAFGVINLVSVGLAAFFLRRFVDRQFSFQQFRHGLAFLTFEMACTLLPKPRRPPWSGSCRNSLRLLPLPLSVCHSCRGN